MLSQISPRLKHSLVALLIKHMVPSVVTNTSVFQLALALLVHGERGIETIYEFRITPKYHDVRSFKVSAAAADKKGLSLNMNTFDGLIYVITDNFDVTINSQNDLKQTHALVSIFAQTNRSDEDNNEVKFPRVKQEESKSVGLRDTLHSIYND